MTGWSCWSLEYKQLLCFFFFDYTKAFDSVSHKASIGKPQAWMSNCMEYVVVNGVSSKPLHVISGGLSWDPFFSYLHQQNQRNC